MSKLTISNLTGSCITASILSPAPRSGLHKLRKSSRKHQTSESLLEPQLDFSTSLPTSFWTIELKLNRNVDGEDGSEFRIRVSMPLGATWKSVDVPEDCPWRVYVMKLNSKHRQVMILERRNLASFMAELPDRLPLSSLSLPGTHDTMALYGWPISQCQTVPLLNQLLGGIRVIDIRLAVVPPPFSLKGPVKTSASPELIAYHGTWPQRTKFFAILNDVYEFLSSPIGQSETVVMSIKQEDGELTPSGLFSEMVRDAIMFGPGGGWVHLNNSIGSSVNRGMWFLENRIPKLGEVRGKVVLFSRFGADGSAWPEGLEGIGIHPKRWPDSRKEGFEWELKGTRVRTHDWYSIPSFFSIPEKVKLGTMNLLPPIGMGQAVMPVTYFSAVNIPLALPPIVAKGFGWPDWGLGVHGVNTLLGKWLLEEMASNFMGANRRRKLQGDREKNVDTFAEEPRIRGWTLLDYYSEPGDSQVVPLLVECNFLGRKPGEEGW